MSSLPQLDLEAPSASAPVRERRFRQAVAHRLRGAAEGFVRWLHRQADRFDLIPSDFGKDVEVDETDATALVREWRRQARLWAAYNPEEMFALKAGGAALGVALVVLVVIVRAVR